jgi:hypothetical protein
MLNFCVLPPSHVMPFLDRTRYYETYIRYVLVTSVSVFNLVLPCYQLASLTAKK